MTLHRLVLLGALGATAFAPAAFSAPRHHGAHHRYVAAHRRVYAAAPYGAPYYQSSAPYYRNSSEPAPLPYVPGPDDNSPGAIVARATIRAQAEPGVTSELAPDARQTATGGPVGGVPGFSGF